MAKDFENLVLDATDEQDGVAAEVTLYIDVQETATYDLRHGTELVRFRFSEGEVVSAARSGDDLILTLANGETIRLNNYFHIFGPTHAGVNGVDVGLAFEEELGAPLVLSGGLGVGAAIAGLALAGIAAAGGGSDTVDAPTSVEVNVTSAQAVSGFPVVDGTATAGATVEVTIAGTSFQTVADDDGNWSIDTSTDIPVEGTFEQLPEGNFTVEAVATNDAGDTANDDAAVVVDDSDAEPLTIDPTDGDVVTGTGVPGSTITLTDDGGTVLGTTEVGDDGVWAFTPETPLSDGTTVTAAQADPDGEPVGTPVDETIDTTPPGPPTVEAGTGELITGTADPDTTVTLTIPGVGEVEVPVAADGTFTYTPDTPLEEGTIVTATATDDAGNTSGVADDPVEGADVVPAPTIVAGDGSVLTGTATPGSMVTITIPGEDPVTVPVGEDGTFTFTPDTPLDDDTPVEVVEVDEDGTPVSEAADDVVENGIEPPFINETDGTVVTGTGVPGATVTLVDGGGEPIGTAVVDDNGAWTITPAQPLDEGTILVATQADDVNTSDDSNIEAVPFEAPVAPPAAPPQDTTPPAAPTVDALETVDNTPVVTGTAVLEPGGTLTVQINGETYTTADDLVVDTDTNTWSVQIPDGNELPLGPVEVVATTSDAAGNTAPDTTTNEVIVTPVTVDPLVTSDATPVITGSVDLADGDTLSVEINGETYTEANGLMIDGDTWSVQIPDGSELAEGPVDVTATVTDADMVATDDLSTFEVIVDLTDPAIPTVDSFETVDATPVLTGSVELEDGETLSVTVNGETYTEEEGLVVDGDTWSLQIPDEEPLTAGANDVIATVTDEAGNTATDISSDEVTVTAPTVDTLVTNDTTPVITGVAILEDGDTLSVLINGTTYTEANGLMIDTENDTWSIQIPDGSDLPLGPVEVAATITDADNNTSTDVTSNEVTIDQTPPAVPTVVSQETNDTTPVVTGAAVLATGDTLSVVINDVTYTTDNGLVIDSDDDTWSVQIPDGSELPLGAVNVTATITDAAGNTSPDVTSGEVVIDTMIELDITKAGGSVIEGTTDPNATVTLDVDGDGETDYSATADGDGNWSVDVDIPEPNAFLSELAYRGGGEVDDEFLEFTAPKNADLSTYFINMYDGPGALVNASSFFSPVDGDGNALGVISLQEILDLVLAENVGTENEGSFEGSVAPDPMAPTAGLDLQVQTHPDSDDYWIILLPAGLNGSNTQTRDTDASTVVLSIVTDAGTEEEEIETLVAWDLDQNGAGLPVGGFGDGVDATPTGTQNTGESRQISSDGTTSTDDTDNVGGELNSVIVELEALVSGTATDAAGNTATDTAVLDIFGPDAPVLDFVDARAISGRAEGATTVLLTFDEASGLDPIEVDVVDGSWTALFDEPLPSGTIVTAVALDPSCNESQETIVEVSSVMITSTASATQASTAEADDGDALELSSEDHFFDLDAADGAAQVDLSGMGANTVSIDVSDVLDMSDTNEVIVLGDADDTVVASGFTDSGETRNIDGQNFDVFSADAGTLLVEEEVTVII